MIWDRLKRYPFALAFVVGILLVTLSVPLFRREPGSPTPIGDMPPWSFVDEAGASVTSVSMAGRTHVLVLVSSTCEGSCARIGRDLALMESLFADVKANVAIVTVDISGADAAGVAAFRERSGGKRSAREGQGGWIALSAAPAAACTLAQESLARVRHIQVPCERLHDLADDPHALIVDGKGRIRACIRLDRDGLDETLHRSLAVVEDRPIETPR